MEEWEKYFSSFVPPANFNEKSSTIEQFCIMHSKKGTKVAFITSGGTMVPLEINTVRFIDNFSAGTRGAASAEYFLKKGFAVVFLYREKSQEPFVRKYSGQDVLHILQEGNDGCIFIKDDASHGLKKVWQDYRRVADASLLLKVPYVTLSDYLWLLRCSAQHLQQHLPNALLYLAAAVSDFYVPKENLNVHKIQSSAGPMTVSFQIVPKMLKPLVSLWAPNLYVISFKLETDKDSLIDKARDALDRYSHNLVIANLLQSRREMVTLVGRNYISELSLSKEELTKGRELEELIVEKVVELYECRSIEMTGRNAIEKCCS